MEYYKNNNNKNTNHNYDHYDNIHALYSIRHNNIIIRHNWI